ncbi:MAG: glycosyltransferase [Gemmatimonadetes bacterium]|nr:MAG: glycosyltransferase [Gemmatimonadota bacterium]
MKTIRIDFCDFWPGFRKDDNRIYNLLKTRYAVELHDRPDFVIYSSFGDHHRLHSCTRIFFTGESHRPDFSTCDYALTCHYVDDPRHLRWPLYAFYYAPDLLVRQDDDVDAIMATKTQFCCFIASNTRHPRTTRKRNAFFHRLSRYKKVDAGGRAFNNIGYQVPGGPLGKIQFLKQYKFNIAFENASLPGYTTEKLVEAMAARCLPIYWGNPLIQREFNSKSFLNYFDFQDEDALIERIIELDESDALYRQCMAEPYFHHNRPNEFFDVDRVLDHFEMIFASSRRPVARRRRLFSFGRWTLARRDPI